MATSLLTEAEIRKIMDPYRGRVADVLIRAYDRWKDLPVEHSVAHSARSRASLIHDYILEAATKEFLSDLHVKVVLKRTTCVLVFHGVVAVRFKKVRGSQLRCSVGSTQRQRGIHEQQLPLDGTDVRPTWATAGYRLDAAGGLAQTALIVTRGDHHQYALDLVTGGVVEPIALPPAEDDEGLVIQPKTAEGGAVNAARTP